MVHPHYLRAQHPMAITMETGRLKEAGLLTSIDARLSEHALHGGVVQPELAGDATFQLIASSSPGLGLAHEHPPH